MLSILAHIGILACWLAASTGVSALIGRFAAALVSPLSGGSFSFWPFAVVFFIGMHLLLAHQVRSEVRIARRRG